MSPLLADTSNKGVCEMTKLVKMFSRKNGKIYMEYKLHNKKVQRSTGLEDTAKNRKLVEAQVMPALEAKIRNGDFDKDKPRVFSYYAQRYLRKKEEKKTYKKMLAYVEILNETFGNMLVDKIRVSDVDDWVYERLKNNTPKTAQNYLSAMSGVLKEAIKTEAISKNVARSIELPKHKKEEIEPFSFDEVYKILSQLEGSLKLLVAIGFFTGLRTGEILVLCGENFDFEKKELQVIHGLSDGQLKTTKTDNVRVVPILDELIPYLEKIPKNGFLFRRKDGSHYAAYPGHYGRRWRSALEELSIDYRKIYATRHTFIVNMLTNSNMSILQIAQLAGHSTIKMIVENYAKFIKGEHLKIDRSFKLFADNATDRVA